MSRYTWFSLPPWYVVSLVFVKLSGDQAVLQIMVYLLANVVGICLGLYKVNAMGLLPTHQSDWLEFMLVRDVSLQQTRARVGAKLGLGAKIGLELS